MRTIRSNYSAIANIVNSDSYKAIVDTESCILGCLLLCYQAGEVISTVQMVMLAQMPYPSSVTFAWLFTPTAASRCSALNGRLISYDRHPVLK